MLQSSFLQQASPASSISPYNPLVVALVLVAAGATLTTVFLFREVRGTHTPDDRQSFAWLFGLVGAIALLVSGEIFWANWAGFPANQYTELFGVAQTLFAFIMLSAAFTVYHRIDGRPFAWVTAIAGIILIQGAHAILSFSLTLSPLISAVIWLSAAIGAILLLPVAYTDPESNTHTYLLYLAVISFGILAISSLVMGFEAHYSHIAEALKPS